MAAISDGRFLIFVLVALLVINAAIVTGLPCNEPCLYYAKVKTIRRVQLQPGTGLAKAGTSIETVYNKGQHITALALDRVNGRMFWYDRGTHMIYKAHLNGTGAQVLIRYGVTFCEGISYDWSSDNIYWTDSGHDRIEVSSVDGKNRKVVVNGGMLRPRGIIVEPFEGYLFWTEIGTNPRIERAKLNGEDRRVIALTDNPGRPNDVQIDYAKKRLYWIDALTDKVESCDYSGANRKVESDVSYFGNILMHPFSMALYAPKSVVYFTDWYRDWVLHQTIGQGTIYAIIRHSSQVKAIGQVRILDGSSQPPATSACLQNNGNCSHLCLKLNGSDHTCACPVGTALQSRPSTAQSSQKICTKVELDYQGFVADGNGKKIFHFSKFVNQSQYLFEALKLPEAGQPVGLDFDQKSGTLYWSDVDLNKIYQMKINGSGFKAIVDKGIETPEGVAIDTVTGLLYFADYNNETIEVVKLDGTMRTTLIRTDLVNPRDIQLYHEKGVMFFSDWGKFNPKIESAFMDGTNRRRIITTSVVTPSGLAIDKIEQRLYWADMSLNRIESSNFDGNDRRILFDHDGFDPYDPFESITGEIQRTYGVAIHRDEVFWSDWDQQQIYSADKRTGGKINFISGLEKPMQLHVYSKTAVKEHKKLYFFARAINSPSTGVSHSCFAKTCNGSFTQDPASCPKGFKQSRFSVTCSNCSAPFGLYDIRCKCENWMSCAHRIYSKLSCPTKKPFMQFKVRECVMDVHPGHCPLYNCPVGAVHNESCASDGDCSDSQKCCNTSCGMKCLTSNTVPETHQCEINNGGCSHFCFRVPNNFACGCPDDMVLQQADKKTCISRIGTCSKIKPCFNEGVCRDVGQNSYNCTCKAGLSGNRCELCQSHPCQHNGRCIKNATATTCLCKQGYYGANCENITPTCTNGYCLNSGTCVVVNNVRKCSCLPNYSGARCESYISVLSTPRGSSRRPPWTTPVRTRSPSTTPVRTTSQIIIPVRTTSARTTPVQTTNPRTTPARTTNPRTTPARTTSPRTSTTQQRSTSTPSTTRKPANPCKPNPCKNNALCSNLNNVAKCQCINSLTGQFCETPLCSTNYCQNGGSCQVVKNVRTCQCNAFYTGKYCETHIVCSPNPCQQNASCIATDDETFKCICPSGYAGTTCQFVDKCKVSPCQNGGDCLNTNTGASCVCLNGYTGALCEIPPPCASSPCGANGVCTNSGAGYTCQCSSGYSGQNCQSYDYCSSSQCRESRQCVNGPSGYTCSCDIAYTGQYCKTRINYCIGSICQNGGACVNGLQNASCICTDTFVGSLCELDYRANILVVTFTSTSSSTLTPEAIQSALASQYTSYCRTTNCKDTQVSTRKRRKIISPVVINKDDIIIVTGYPKTLENSQIEVQYTVKATADGKTFLLPPNVIQKGFEASKASLESALRIKVSKVQLIGSKGTVKPPGKSTGNKDNPKSGLVAGMVVVVLCLIFIGIVATYYVRRRRKQQNENGGFNAFDNVMYRSNTDLQTKQEPNVQIQQQQRVSPQQNGGHKSPLEFNNVIYDGRRAYSEMSSVDLSTDATAAKDPNPIHIESRNGMTGLVNPYAELPEYEKQPAHVVTTCATTISSPKMSLPSIELYNAPPLPKKTPLPKIHVPYDSELERPSIVQVQSMKRDSVDGLSGFANPCAVVDDDLFSEDDTRENLGSIEDYSGSLEADLNLAGAVANEPTIAVDGESTDPPIQNPNSSSRKYWVKVEDESSA